MRNVTIKITSYDLAHNALDAVQRDTVADVFWYKASGILGKRHDEVAVYWAVPFPQTTACNMPAFTLEVELTFEISDIARVAKELLEGFMEHRPLSIVLDYAIVIRTPGTSYRDEMMK